MSEENEGRTGGQNHTRWFVRLVEKLPLRKLTRAQTLNALCDGLGWLGFVLYTVFTKASNFYAMVMFIVLVLFMVWCIRTSKPVIKRQ